MTFSGTHRAHIESCRQHTTASMADVWVYERDRLIQDRLNMEAEDWAERKIITDSSVANLVESDREIADRRRSK